MLLCSLICGKEIEETLLALLPSCAWGVSDVLGVTYRARLGLFLCILCACWQAGRVTALLSPLRLGFYSFKTLLVLLYWSKSVILIKY